MTTINQSYLNIAKLAALKAGDAIMEVFNSEDFGVEFKKDESPVTKADFAANDIINALLDKTGLPIMSEENDEIPYQERKNWKSYWLVDPLDGTKSFIKREPEFSVNIALIENGRTILGVVYAPVSQTLYWGSKDKGAYRLQNSKTRLLQISKINNPIRVVISKNHLDENTKNFIKKFDNPVLKKYGSSLKIIAIAESDADIYPRLRSSTMKWDTAAAQAVLEAAGGHLRTVDGEELTYNRRDLLNPGFIACNDPKLCGNL